MASHSAGGFICCVPGCFSNSKKDVDLSLCGFSKEKKLRSGWLHKISWENFFPRTRHLVCSLHFEGGKKTYMNNVPVLFPVAKSNLRPSPKPRTKVVLTGPSTCSQEALPRAISAAWKEAHESEGGGTHNRLNNWEKNCKTFCTNMNHWNMICPSPNLV